MASPAAAVERGMGGMANAPINQARITELRAAVREGRYAIAPQRVAEAMIAAGALYTGSGS